MDAMNLYIYTNLVLCEHRHLGDVLSQTEFALYLEKITVIMLESQVERYLC